MPRGRGERDRGQYDDATDVFSACGGAALYRRAAFDDVGLFDDAFFAQMEDVDWGFRARLLGYGCRYVPGAVVYHKGSASMRREGRPDPWFWGLPVRNCIWMWSKNYPRDCLLRNAHLLLAHELAGLYFAAREGMLRAQLRAWRDALRGLPRVLRQRREIQARRQIGRRELDHVIQPEVVSWRRLGALVRRGRPAPGARWQRFASCASCPGMKLPLPSHHGQVTVLGEPPRLDTTWPVPRQGRQAWGSRG